MARGIKCPECEAVIDMGRSLPGTGATVKNMVTGEPLIVDCRSCGLAVIVEPTVNWRVGVNPADFFDNNTESVPSLQGSRHEHSYQERSEAHQ